MTTGLAATQSQQSCLVIRQTVPRSRSLGAFSGHLPRQLPHQSRSDATLTEQHSTQPSIAFTHANCGRRRDISASAHSSKHGDSDLPVSLYWPYKNLPPDGKTRTEGEELCNPEERSCQTPMHVFERKCKPCTGTGMISSNTRGRRRVSSYTCPICHGLGYVRHTSSRFIPPNLNNGTGDYTLGRPVPIPPTEQEEGKKRKFPFRR